MIENALDELHVQTLQATHPEWEDLMCSPMLEDLKLTDEDLKSLQYAYDLTDWDIRTKEMNIGIIRELWNEDESERYYQHFPVTEMERNTLFNLWNTLTDRNLDFAPSMITMENGRIQYWDDDEDFNLVLVCEAPAQYFYEICEILQYHPNDQLRTLIVALASRDKLAKTKKTLRKAV